MSPDPRPPDSRPPELAGPVAPPERIAAIDVLRGVALLGILLLNIAGFSMAQPAYGAPTLGGGPLVGSNYAVWLLQRTVGDQRFMSLFAVLFGAGIALSTGRSDARGADAARLHRRRMLGLLGIGLLHAYLLWWGDVLVAYALIGLPAYAFRHRPTRQLVAVGGGLLLLGWGLTLPSAVGTMLAARELPATYETLLGVDRPDLITETTAYRGTYVDTLRQRADQTFDEEMFSVVIYGPRIGGLMLLGMAALRLNLLDGRAPPGPQLRLAAGGLLVGLPLTALDLWGWHAHRFSLTWAYGGAMLVNYWASLAMAAAYAGLIVPLSARLPPPLTRPFAAVGRTALSNYLLQTILCTTLFYGYGFGRFAAFDRTHQFYVVLAIWAVQLTLSPLWLLAFRFGPAEWIWRSITYGRLQPVANRQPTR